MGFGAFAGPAVSGYTVSVAQKGAARSRSALGVQLLWLVLEPHAHAGFDKLNLAEILFNVGEGSLVDPEAVMGEEVINNGGEKNGIPS